MELGVDGVILFATTAPTEYAIWLSERTDDGYQAVPLHLTEKAS